MDGARKRRLAKAAAKYTVNPVVKAGMAVGVLPRGTLLLETTGRTSGQPRRTPVGGRVEGNTVWIVSEHGPNAAYVRNIAKTARVRVRIGRIWREGHATALPDDDWRARLRAIGRGNPWLKLNGAVVRMMGTTSMTIRIDLDP
jgi:deazaflavin-dependent oxidoreductase (nitroreductase family)